MSVDEARTQGHTQVPARPAQAHGLGLGVPLAGHWQGTLSSTAEVAARVPNVTAAMLPTPPHGLGLQARAQWALVVTPAVWALV